MGKALVSGYSQARPKLFMGDRSLTEASEKDNKSLVILEEKSDGDAVILAIRWGDQTIPRSIMEKAVAQSAYTASKLYD